MTFAEKHVHFIGIGGIGMSGIAALMLRLGVTVTGSDTKPSDVTRRLESRGAAVAYGQRPENIPTDTELVVVTAAIKPDNPELIEANRRGIAVQKYAQVLGRVALQFRTIAVSGTHGKTTTTAMVTCMLRKMGLDPSYVVGAAVGSLGGSSGVGQGEHFVVEACEYDRSFLNLHPCVAVINNIEEDHLDYYRDIGEIQEAFAQFASQVDPTGLLVVNAGDPRALEAARHAPSEVQTFGIGVEADWRADKLESARGQFAFDVSFRGKRLGRCELGIPGKHNVSNALASLACARWAGVSMEQSRKVLKTFRGADRRFQKVAEVGGITVVDDYAHHPTEIAATLEAARAYFAARRIWVVFQPHQHSRTRFFLEEFAHSFSHADVVIVPQIYFVRDTEEDRRSVTAEDLVARMKALHRDARHIADFDEIVRVLRCGLQTGDVVITMGAGPINQVGRDLVEALGIPDSSRSAG